MSSINNYRGPVKIPPYTRLISSSNPEEDVWNYIEQLTNIEFVLDLLKERVKRNFYGFGEFIERIDKKKVLHCCENASGLRGIEFHETLDFGYVEMNAKEIVSLTKQAIELCRSSKQTSLYSKPITLYYSYAKLGRVLFLSTYKSKQAVQKHGLALVNNAIICKSGAFARFHDSYNWDPEVYLAECIFKWKDLIQDPLKTRVPDLILNMKWWNFAHMKERRTDNSNFIEHELTREYLFLYAMSFLARYNVEYWSRLMTGSAIAWHIQNYLNATQVLFPNLIFNQLHGAQYYFYPTEPLFMSLEEPVILAGEPNWLF